MSQLSERLARLETKMDSLINSIHDARQEQKERCNQHGCRLAKLEAERNKILGASWLGGALSGIIGAWWAGHK